MIPENRVPTHPGVILSQEFLAPLHISQWRSPPISACRSSG
jgi:plasmid maintenance system antidote protein VapI